jgi:1-acyl-sn-glycerol-3-phosphate acyltransferase
MAYWILKIILGPIIRLIWIKEVRGLENFPRKGSVIIAANHSSYFDFISLVAILPRRVYFLAAEKFYQNWLWAPIVKLTKQIKIERQESNKKEAYDKISSILKNNGVIGIFPEGTRSPDGKIHKTFTGVAKFALSTKTSVVPIGINGAYEILPRQKRVPMFRKIIEINIGPKVDLSDFNDKNIGESTLRGATDLIMLEIFKLSST